MTWVLWDILIPLITVFALGVLFGWLEWGWRRRNRYRRTMDAELAVANGFSLDSSEPVFGQADDDVTASSADAEENAPSSALPDKTIKELEAANITLIGERDDATLALEALQQQEQALNDRIEELESAQNQPDKDIDQEIEERTQQEKLTAPVTDLSAGLLATAHDAAQLERLQQEARGLNETLAKERNARRATELELLNIKNRHDKLAAASVSRIPVEKHQQEVKDRDDQIEHLQLQLAALADRDDLQSDPLDASSQVTVADESVHAELHDDSIDEPGTNKPGINKPELSKPEPADQEKDNQKPAQLKLDGHDSAHPQPARQSPPDRNDRDKLTSIKGIGSVLESKLHECGIYFYHQLAELDEKGVEELQSRIPQFPGRIKRDQWVEQAIELQREKTHA